jgi:uncharacterized protein
MSNFIQLVKVAAWDAMQSQDAAHDWAHIERVRHWALKIAEIEGGDKTIIELAALVHDVGDRKVHESEEAGDHAVRYLLLSCGVPSPCLNIVADIARKVSFKGFDVPDDMPTIEGKIVQDADRLDAIGAIAIARTFTWGGAKGRVIYDPKEPIFRAATAEEYYALGGRTSVNHFHEKLLHLKDRLHTDTAKRVASQRHAFMLQFLEQFRQEWDCEV